MTKKNEKKLIVTRGAAGATLINPIPSNSMERLKNAIGSGEEGREGIRSSLWGGEWKWTTREGLSNRRARLLFWVGGGSQFPGLNAVQSFRISGICRREKPLTRQSMSLLRERRRSGKKFNKGRSKLLWGGREFEKRFQMGKNHSRPHSERRGSQSGTGKEDSTMGYR